MVYTKWWAEHAINGTQILISVLGEVEFLDVFQESYAAIMRYCRAADGFGVRD